MTCLSCGTQSKGRYCEKCYKLLTQIKGYCFICKCCKKPFVMDGVQILDLKVRFGENYKQPSLCKKCKTEVKNDTRNHLQEPSSKIS